MMMMMMMIFVVMVAMLTCDCTLMVVCSGSWWRERELKRAWCKLAANTRPLWTWTWITMSTILMIDYSVMIRTHHTPYKIEHDHDLDNFDFCFDIKLS